MKNNQLMKLSAIISFAMLLLVVTECASQGYINPSIELTNRIGDRSSVGKNYQLQIPTDIVMNGEKQFYVINSGSHQIMLFDFNGKLIKQFGKKGSNPSEFYYPYSIDIDSKGNIFVSDLGNNRIQCFDENGTYQRELQFTTGNMRLNSSGDISVTRAHGDFDYAIEKADIFPNDSNIQILTFKGNKKYSLSQKLEYNNSRMDVKGNEVYVDFDDSNNVVVVYAYSSLMEKYDSSGKIIWKKEHRLNFDATMPKETKDQTSTFQEVQMNKCHAGIAVDKKGRIWVVTLNRQFNSEERVNTDLLIMRGFDGTKKLTISVSNYTGPSTVNVFKIDIFDPDGKFISSIPLTHFADNIRIFGHNLFIIDSYHKQQILHYEIID